MLTLSLAMMRHLQDGKHQRGGGGVGERRGVPVALVTEEDGMERAGLRSDWLAGCGAPLRGEEGVDDRTAPSLLLHLGQE